MSAETPTNDPVRVPDASITLMRSWSKRPVYAHRCIILTLLVAACVATGTVRTSVSSLCAETGLTTKVVRNVLSNLSEDGIITVNKSRGNSMEITVHSERANFWANQRANSDDSQPVETADVATDCDDKRANQRANLAGSGDERANQRANSELDLKRKKEERSKEEIKEKNNLITGAGARTREEVATPKSFKQWTAEEFAGYVNAMNNAKGYLSPEETATFIGYWTERSASKQMRFAAEKFFEIGRRLGTWASRSGKSPWFGSEAGNADKTLEQRKTAAAQIAAAAETARLEVRHNTVPEAITKERANTQAAIDAWRREEEAVFSKAAKMRQCGGEEDATETIQTWYEGRFGKRHNERGAIITLPRRDDFGGMAKAYENSVASSRGRIMLEVVAFRGMEPDGIENHEYYKAALALARSFGFGMDTLFEVARWAISQDRFRLKNDIPYGFEVKPNL